MHMEDSDGHCRADSMTPSELEAWQKRLGYSQVEAARRLATPVPTYRHWLGGRRRIPDNVALLCRYIEKFGSLVDESG